ncbi:hypothetical protein FACS18947_1150 [Bacteroidia bacterium]|nr:hypothetical protein FACS18947_1150 [Bacteroidia bacterium]
MKYKVYESVINDITFRIEEDYPTVGAYLYVFKKGQCIEDYLQENIEECKLFALEEYNVSIDSWLSST